MSNIVLVVDDEEAIRTNVRDYLTFSGYAVDTASSATEALAKVLEVEYTYVLLDVQLGAGMNGVNLHKLLSLFRPEIRYMFFTGGTTPLPVGVEVFRKPVSLASIVKHLNSLGGC